MQKYAAVTALAIALSIPMLTPAAASWCWTKMDGSGGFLCQCTYQCWGGKPGTELATVMYLAKLRRCKPGAFCDTLLIPPDIQACLSKCRAAQH
jgi:hypothetical protein